MAKLTKVEPKDIDFLKELDDGSVVFTKYATIIVPDKYFEKNIAEFIGSSVSIFGLITINVYDSEIDDDDNLDKAPFNEFFFKFKFFFIDFFIICKIKIIDKSAYTNCSVNDLLLFSCRKKFCFIAFQ